jgi:transmembrane sensor
MKAMHWHKVNKEVQDEAIRWHARLCATDTSDAEYEAFSKWIAADPQHAAAFGFVEEMDEKLDSLRAVDPGGLDGLLQKNVTAPTPSVANDNLVRRRIAIAASVVMFLSLSIFTLTGSRLFSGVEHIALSAPADQFRVSRLSDGSVITLAPGASFEADLRKRQRSVSKLSGVAYFDVAPDKQRPFSIALGDHIVTVVGTEFEIGAFDAHQNIAVAEGIVSVRNTSAPPMTATHLSIGEQMSLSGQSPEGAISKVTPADVGAWRGGQFEFDGATAQTIIDRLNRFYGRSVFVIDPENPPSFQLSGILSLADPAGTAERLSELTGAEIMQIDSGEYSLSAN